MAATGSFVGTPKLGLQQILPADTTAAKTVVSAGASGSKVVSLTATSDDTARIVRVSLVRSAVVYVLGTTTIAALAGTDGVVNSANLLSSIPGLPLDNDGQPYINIVSGDTLTVAVTVAVTAAKTISITSVFGDF